MSKPKAIIVSGYFNPLHKGHLELFEKAKAAGDELWVIVNSDLQRELKGSKEFMLEDERLIIVRAIGIVDKALISIDRDKTQCATLANLADKYSSDYDYYIRHGMFLNMNRDCQGYVLYDNNGISKKNKWRRNIETIFIINNISRVSCNRG